MDCRYSSTGWSAWDAKGVGTAGKHVNQQETEKNDPMYLALCDAACGRFCIAWDDGEYDEPSIQETR